MMIGIASAVRAHKNEGYENVIATKLINGAPIP